MRVLYISGRRREESPLLEAADGIEYAEVSIHLRSEKGLSFLKKVRDVRSMLRGFRPDVVLVEGMGLGSLPAVFFAARRGIPVAARMKGDPWREHAEAGIGIALKERVANWINFRCASFILDRAKMALPISDRVEERIIASLTRPPATRVVHIPYRGPADDGRRTGGRPYVLSVTNFNFRGKVMPMVDAMPAFYPALLRRGLDWLIIGDGFHLEECRAKAEGFKDRIRLIGRQDAAGYYKGPAQCLLHISGMDGLPNVLLEAWANRVPVVMNADCPAAEFIEDGKDGLLADAGDPVGIGRVIEGLAHDEARRGALAEEGYTHVKDAFSIDKVSADLKGALEDCLAK